jgi:hypothetical protein
MSSFKVSNIYKSIVRHLVDTIDVVKLSGVSSQLEYYAWDSRGDEAELEAKDLIGLAGWTFKENGGLWQVYAGIDAFCEECKIPMRNDAGAEYTQLVVKEFAMLASGQSEKRNFRPIGLELLRTSND